ncbi:hypothetical protein DPMN_000105 [Dreissena polymorpha]|uniref:Uncharacterized protein n=1 Tax=Dreissena polymorpha TaxID=45954 RepID=A0A9D4MJ42_DREPO|nr:hypothetical protein DPMN_000105 [Dreissena polymorpha]
MFWLEHTCTSIAYNQDSLFITSGTALYQYSMIGKLVKRMYQDPSGLRTVHKCVVGPNCGRLYITNLDQNNLLTLNVDGALLSTFTDPQITDAFTVYVTPLGQVLVCDGSSKTIIQVDGEGKSKLATLATEQDGVSGPMSLYYNTNTDSLIVALWDNNTMLVFDVLQETFPRKFRYPKFKCL